MELDLERTEVIDLFVGQILENFGKHNVKILFNNAGCFYEIETTNGINSQISINYTGTRYLTEKCLENQLFTEDAKIICTSSRMGKYFFLENKNPEVYQ
jgi:NAD(P)-dependent dehydrogenase (short-subunit alcohol dehydrogenase family)